MPEIKIKIPFEPSVELMRALTVGANSIKLRSDIPDLTVQNYEVMLTSLRDAIGEIVEPYYK